MAPSCRPLFWVANLVLSATLFDGIVVAEGVGIKRRLMEADDEGGGRNDEGCSAVGDATRRGGVARRVAGASSSSSSSTKTPLNNDLRKDWARGKMSSAQVQRIAQSALEQGADDLDAIGAAGSRGEQRGNVFRALKTLFGTPEGAPEIRWIEIPTAAGPSTPHPFLLPHEFFSAMYEGRPKEWETMITGAADACLRYWESVSESDFVRRHPTLPRSEWGKIVPIGLHGDGGRFSNQDSLMTIAWNSLLGEGTTLQKRFLFTVIRKTDMNTETMNAIMRVFAWSVNSLLGGRTPSRDCGGRKIRGKQVAIAGGWKAAFCQVRGDWQFYTELFQFPAWNAAVRMCWLCKASSTIRRLAWTDSRPEAGWRRTRFTHESYLAHLAEIGQTVPVLFELAVGLRQSCVMVDTLHTVDLGVAAHIIGNVFVILAIHRAVFGGRTYDDRVKRLQQHLNDWYRRTRATSKLQGAITLERLRTDGGWPKLKAKAAATRNLADYALELMETYGNAGIEDDMAKSICRLLVRFYTILREEDLILSDAAKVELPELGQRLGVLYASLSARALAREQRLWKLVPKMHLFVHLCEWQGPLYGNPSAYWTYADEDLVGKMVEVAKTCHPKTLAETALVKWLHAYFLE